MPRRLERASTAMGGQSQSARVPLSNRTACLGSHSTLSHRTARLTDRLHASPPYHDITTSTRNPPSLPPCVPPNRPPPSSISSSTAYSNRPQSLSSSPPSTTSDAQTPNCFGPTPQPTSKPVSNIAAVPSSASRRPPDCACAHPPESAETVREKRAHARPVALSAEAHASITSTHRFLPARIRPTLLLDPDSILRSRLGARPTKIA